MVTMADAARRVGINYWTLISWLRASEVTVTRLGAYKLVDLAEVERLVARKRQVA